MKAPNINLHHIDCIKFMKLCEDNKYDLSIVDPNWGIGESSKDHNSRNTPYKERNGSFTRIKNKNYTRKDWDNKRPSKEYFIELLRVSRNVIIFGGNHFTDLIPEFSSGRIIWDKVNGSSDFSDCEIAWTNLFSSTRLFSYMWNGMLQGKSAIEGRTNQGNKKLCEVRIHPTQKPVILYKWLLSKYAKEGYKIFDSHLGSASIAIGCHDLGFDLDGCENDIEYYDNLTYRVEQHKRQLSLFA